LNIDFGINKERQDYKIGTVGGDEGEGLHIPTQNRMIKPLAIALHVAVRGLWGAGRRWWGRSSQCIM
jgi:hypothetical protein